ncbi:MAG: prepilin-type N-terminal cleavage/methylation domain-containing protein [Clostridia bacterium]
MIELTHYIKNKKGFTIAELLIAVSLLLLVLIIGYMVFSTLSNNFATGTDQSYVQQNIRFVDDYFKSNVRNIGQFYIGDIPPANLGYSVFVESDIAKAGDTDITDSVIDDVTVKVDFSGEFVVLEYTVTGHDGNQTYEIENKVVLNNVPTDSVSAGTVISGTYDGGDISLQSNKLFFNYDPIYRKLRTLVASPGIVTTVQNYDAGSPLPVYLILSNDSFLSGITILDITIAGDISGLSINNLTRENNNRLLLELIGSTPGLTAPGSGTITVDGDYLVGDGDLSVTIPVEDPYAAYMIIYGAESVAIPETGGSPVTTQYTAVVYDQGTNEFPSANADIVWTQTPPSYDGVVISSLNNVLTMVVSDTALPGSIKFGAKMSTNESIAWEYTIDLVVATP